MSYSPDRHWIPKSLKCNAGCSVRGYGMKVLHFPSTPVPDCHGGGALYYRGIKEPM